MWSSAKRSRWIFRSSWINSGAPTILAFATIGNGTPLLRAQASIPLSKVDDGRYSGVGLSLAEAGYATTRLRPSCLAV